MKGYIFNIQRFSIHDGPGIRTTVFFKGCPLRCKWCANPESQNADRQLMYDKTACILCGKCAAACPNKAIEMIDGGLKFLNELCTQCRRCVSACSIQGTQALTMQGEGKTIEEVFAEIVKDKVFYDNSGGGVTFSGGEVIEQLDYAEALATRLKNLDIHIACETAGFASTEEFSRLMKITDLFLFDVKHYDGDAHFSGTGARNEQILRNLETAVLKGQNVIARIPVIPGFNDTELDGHNFGKLLQRLHVEQVHLLPFHQFGSGKYEKLGIDYALKNVKSLSREDLEGIKSIIEKYIPIVRIGG